MSSSAVRWQVEQVLALAPRPTSLAAARPLAVASRWTGTGCDERGLWGRCTGGSAEPYECVVDHVAAAARCSCPSRQHPCKHSLALLLLWVQGLVPEALSRPGFADSHLARRAAAVTPPAPPPAPPPAAASAEGVNEGVNEGLDGPAAATSPAPVPSLPNIDSRDQRDDRVARMAAGLAELDRWLDDRLRTGLADPVLARYATWDELAARLTDAQVGGLANRVRRLAGVVGAHPQWHEQVLAEMGMLHLLARAGRSLGSLPAGLADSVAAAIGWQVRQADVLAGVPITDQWAVLGRSDVREDRIEVRRVWLRGVHTRRWAMVLSFAAYGQSLDQSLVVGSVVHADVFAYPGSLGLRVLVGRQHSPPVEGVSAALSGGAEPLFASVTDACAEVGTAVAAEPWIDRVPLMVHAAPARDRAGWVLADHSGSLPLVEGVGGVAALLACSAGEAVIVMAEWTPLGVVPLAVHLADRSIDIGPTADPTFVAATSGGLR